MLYTYITHTHTHTHTREEWESSITESQGEAHTSKPPHFHTACTPSSCIFSIIKEYPQGLLPSGSLSLPNLRMQKPEGNVYCLLKTNTHTHTHTYIHFFQLAILFLDSPSWQEMQLNLRVTMGGIQGTPAMCQAECHLGYFSFCHEQIRSNLRA